MNDPLSLRSFFDDLEAWVHLSRAAILGGAVRLIFVWVLAWLANRLVKVLAKRIVDRVDDGDDSRLTSAEKRGQTIALLLRSLGRVVIVGVALLLSLNVFVDIGPLLAGAGILGLAVSFGAQSLVKDLIAGFFILFENQFAVGDDVEAGGKAGVVERMTLRAVILRDVRGVVHIIPNGQITTVSNLTRGWSRAVIDLTISYDTELDRALQVLRDEAARFEQDAEWSRNLSGPVQALGVQDLSNVGVVIRIVARTFPGSQFEVGRELRRRLKNRMDAEGIEIPILQATVHVGLAPPVTPQGKP